MRTAAPNAAAARPPKIIFVNRFFYPDLSATSQMLTDIAGRLDEAGAEIHVVCSRQLYENPAARLAARDLLGNIRVHRVWTAQFGRSRLLGRALDYASFYVTCTVTLLRLTRRNDILVVKTDPPLLSLIGALVATLRNAKLVNWLQDVFPEVATRLGVAPWPRWFERALQTLRDRSLRAARINIVLGERMRAYLIGRGVAPGQLRIIENWADGVAVRPKASAHSELRRGLELQQHFVVAYSGNLGRAHEIETLLAAAGLLRREPEFVFLMIGGGARLQELRRRVADQGLASFHFLPYQQREVLSDSLAAADVHLACLLPQLEGLIVPSKIYGILAAGRPTVFIGDPAGDVARVIGSANCGVTVECGDGAALARELRTLRADPVGLQELGRRARQVFEERHTLDSAVQSWLQLLADLDTRTVPRTATLQPSAAELDELVSSE